MKQTKTPVFDAQVFLDSAGVARKVVEFQRNATIFAQGDSSKHVMYVEIGSVKLSVVNEVGKEAVVAMLGPGDFFGEGCMEIVPGLVESGGSRLRARYATCSC